MRARRSAAATFFIFISSCPRPTTFAAGLGESRPRREAVKKWTSPEVRSRHCGRRRPWLCGMECCVPGPLPMAQQWSVAQRRVSGPRGGCSGPVLRCVPDPRAGRHHVRADRERALQLDLKASKRSCCSGSTSTPKNAAGRDRLGRMLSSRAQSESCRAEGPRAWMNSPWWRGLRHSWRANQSEVDRTKHPARGKLATREA